MSVKVEVKNEENMEKDEVENAQKIKEEIKIIKEQIKIEEPILGSVTTYNITDGSEIKSQQIRSSARVFKKMKLDTTVPVVVEKAEKKEEVKNDISTKKCFRPLWNSDDKTLFFEALNEYGKDFENIHLYILSKMRKKGVPENMIKSRDQVRHLYYRTWQKASKYLKFPEEVRKVVQELYALINYGELRKKLGSVNEKTCMKLNELVYNGFIVLRFKGKSIRVKTPMCRALRRLNQLDEKYDEINLPTRVTIELVPRDLRTYLKVQQLAQNPRMKTVLPLQKRLSVILNYLNLKLKSVDSKMYEKSVISAAPVTADLVPPAEVIEENKKTISSTIRIAPPLGAKIEIPSINLSEYFTTQSICFTSFESRLGLQPSERRFDIFKPNKNSPKKSYRQRTDSASDKSEKSPSKAGTVSSLDDMDMKSPDREVSKHIDDAVNTILALQMEQKQEIKEDETSNETPLEAAKEKVEEVDPVKLKIDKIRKGWTEEDCATLTIGEIYLMIGNDSKLVLEYGWDNIWDHSLGVTPETTVPNNVGHGLQQEPLTDSLQKLLSVAKMHYRKNIIKCPCGHICGQKNNTQLKKAMESKIRKMLTDIVEPDDKATNEEQIFENEQTFVAPPVYVAPKLHTISPATSFYQPANNIHLINQLDSIKKMKPKYCNRKGRRPRSKQVVVERKLPLLPNNVGSGHQIVRMNIISQEPRVPVTTPSVTVKIEEKPPVEISLPTASEIKNKNIFLMDDDSLLNFSDTTTKSDSLLNMSSDNAMGRGSPSHILNESHPDNHWINAEVGDYSLSSLLGHLESPVKGSHDMTDEAHISSDVDAQLRSLLTESSLDFSANFADLAASVQK